MRYRFKPNEVEAFQFQGAGTHDTWPKWAQQARENGFMRCGIAGDFSYTWIEIATFHGVEKGMVGDYVVKNLDTNEIYVMREDLFEGICERVK